MIEISEPAKNNPQHTRRLDLIFFSKVRVMCVWVCTCMCMCIGYFLTVGIVLQLVFFLKQTSSLFISCHQFKENVENVELIPFGFSDNNVSGLHGSWIGFVNMLQWGVKLV